MKQFQNPWENIVPPDREHRTSLILSGQAYSFISGVHCRKGTLQTTINILLEKAIQLLKDNGITAYDPDAYERTIVNSTLTLPGANVGTTGGSGGDPNGEAAVVHDGRGTQGIPQSDAGVRPATGDPSGGNQAKGKARQKRTKA